MKTYKLYPIYKKSVVDTETATINGKEYTSEVHYRWAEFQVDLPIAGVATLADQEYIDNLEFYLEKLGGENFEILELIDECARFNEIDGECADEDDEEFDEGLWTQADYQSVISIECQLKVEAV